jgi:hypothetical protein
MTLWLAAKVIVVKHARKKLIVLELSNGSTFSFPPNLAQGLAHAQPADLADIEVTPLGVGLHWPKLNADLTVEGLFLYFSNL